MKGSKIALWPTASDFVSALFAGDASADYSQC